MKQQCASLKKVFYSILCQEIVCCPIFFNYTPSPSDQVVIHIQRPEDTPLNSHRRLIWCPFIQDDNEDSPEDGSQTLALLHEDRVRLFVHIVQGS